MKSNAQVSASESQFELKYCERCGGLWLRPAGGAQVYCVTCGRSMAELPPATREVGRAAMPGGRSWSMEEEQFEGSGENSFDPDAAGGVA